MRALILVSLLVAACGGAPTAQPKPVQQPESPQPSAPTAEELTAPQGHLTLADITLKQNGEPGLVLHSDGTVEAPRAKRVLGTLHVDGRFVDPKGSQLARLTEDGEVVVGNEEYLPVKIGADGSVQLLKENRTIRLAQDGSLTGANESGPVVTVEGASDKTRRTAMYLLVLSAYPVANEP